MRSTAVSLMTGPTSVVSSRPSPRTSFATRCWSRWTKSSWMDRWTISRDAAVHRCPDVPNADQTTLSSARSRSASSQITIGFLPPSSRLTRFERLRRSAADLDAGIGVAREADDPDVGVVDDRVADLRAGAGDDVHDALGKPALDQELDEADEARRRVRGGLDDGGVAADERREELPGRDGDREVPGRDDPDHADRAGGWPSRTCPASRTAPSGRRAVGPLRPCSRRRRSPPARRRAPPAGPCPSRAS